MTPDVVIIVPVLDRPQNVQPLLSSIQSTTFEPYRVLFVGTESDREENRTVREAGADLLVLPGRRIAGDYARKINYAYRNSTEPLLFLAADDLKFHKDWLTEAHTLLDEGYQVVGTNDLGNERVMKGYHSTHTFVTRAYVDEFGTIDQPGEVLHEGYNHWYVDDEFIQTAQARDTFHPCRRSHVEHLHYGWHKAPMDNIYKLGESKRKTDKSLFYIRRPQWMPGAGPEPGKYRPLPGPDGLIHEVSGVHQ